MADDKKITDFGMEDAEESKQTIGQALNEFKKNQVPQGQNTDQTGRPQAQPQVQPQASVPATPPTAVSNSVQPKPLPETEAPQTPPTQAPTTFQNQPQPQTQAQSSKNGGVPTRNSTQGVSAKALVWLAALFGGLLLAFLVLSFVFLGQTNNGVNPIARLLNVNDAFFVNGLINFINAIFIVLAMTAFSFAAIGFFRAGMSKKDDKVTKKQALRSSLVAGTVLFFTLLVWIFVFIYLEGKRIDVGPQVQDPIITTPKNTIGLTAPIDVRFEAGNIPVERGFSIISWNWDFGDGEKGNNKITSHTYDELGDYTVILTVRKRNATNNEISESTYKTVVTIANQAISAIFNYSPKDASAPTKINFDASESFDPDGKISSYEWDFDNDGVFDDAVGAKAEREFRRNGEFKVSLRVTSTTGDYAVSTQAVKLSEGIKPQAVISVVDKPERYEINRNYIFRADESSSENGNIVKYSWDFGDGKKPVETRSASTSFSTPGTYEITLKVTDNNGAEGETGLKIKVLAPQGTPRADFTTSPAQPAEAKLLQGELPFTVAFDASSSSDSDNNIIDYQWDFNGDNQNDSVGQTTANTFKTAGDFVTRLTVVDADGNKGEKTLLIKVLEQSLKADIRADKTDGTVPLDIEFDAGASSFPSGRIVNYEWDFGDGSEPVQGNAKISHRYTQVGTFKVKMTATASDNTKATQELNVTVREVALQACYTSVFEEGKAPLQTSFDPACTTGTAVSYFWDFGDGNTSTEVRPSHTFAKPGEYRTTLEVSDSNKTISKATLKITVK